MVDNTFPLVATASQAANALSVIAQPDSDPLSTESLLHENVQQDRTADTVAAPWQYASKSQISTATSGPAANDHAAGVYGAVVASTMAFGLPDMSPPVLNPPTASEPVVGMVGHEADHKEHLDKLLPVAGWLTDTTGKSFRQNELLGDRFLTMRQPVNARYEVIPFQHASYELAWRVQGWIHQLDNKAFIHYFCVYEHENGGAELLADIFHRDILQERGLLRALYDQGRWQLVEYKSQQQGHFKIGFPRIESSDTTLLEASKEGRSLIEEISKLSTFVPWLVEIRRIDKGDPDDYLDGGHVRGQGVLKPKGYRVSVADIPDKAEHANYAVVVQDGGNAGGNGGDVAGQVDHDEEMDDDDYGNGGGSGSSSGRSDSDRGDKGTASPVSASPAGKDGNGHGGGDSAGVPSSSGVAGPSHAWNGGKALGHERYTGSGKGMAKKGGFFGGGLGAQPSDDDTGPSNNSSPTNDGTPGDLAGLADLLDKFGKNTITSGSGSGIFDATTATKASPTTAGLGFAFGKLGSSDDGATDSGSDDDLEITGFDNSTDLKQECGKIGGGSVGRKRGWKM